MHAVLPSVGIFSDQQQQQRQPEYSGGGREVRVEPTSTYTRSEQTLSDNDGRTQRHTVEEHQTSTSYSGADGGGGGGGSLTRSTTTQRRQMTSYTSHTDDLHQRTQRERLDVVLD